MYLMKENENSIAVAQKPFLKWAGGKRWFVQRYGDMLPRKFNRYIEPFLGGGAVFFYLRPEEALLGDTNRELVESYEALKSDWKLVCRYLRKHQKLHSREYYYNVRDAEYRSRASRAARFIYLNRTGWDGLYRVNRSGRFNVPVGNRSTVVYDDDDFRELSETLKSAELIVGDFEGLIDSAGRGDLLFVDPPYTVQHNHNAFIKYNEHLFSWSDQERLCYALRRAKSRGASIVATNAYHHSVMDLYDEEFETFCVTRLSRISSKVEARRQTEELVVLARGDI